MDFIKKAKNAMKEHPELTNDLKNLFIDKDRKGSPQNSATSTSGINSATSSVPGTSNLDLTPRSTISSTTSKGISTKVPLCTFPGAPTKPSLADRRKIRDDFEEKKHDLEKEFSNILGAPWSISVDTVGVYSYMNNDSHALSNPGLFILNYFQGALKWLRIFVQKYGQNGANRIDSLASLHLITLEPTNNTSVKFYDTDFVNGRWRLLFRDKAFGWNATDCGSNLEDVINVASKSDSSGASISLVAQQNIKAEYDSKIDAQLALARTYLNEPALSFQPNLEANYAFLASFDAAIDRSDREDSKRLRADWEKNFGAATYSYFAGFVSQLSFKKFNKDDMMQDAFKEVIVSNNVQLLITGSLSRNRNDCVIEDGVLIMRTDPQNWWTNANSACDQLDSLL